MSAPTSKLRVRFVFNRRSGGKVAEMTGGTRRLDNFARVLVRDVAFKYSDGLFQKLKTDIANRIKSDVDRELQHMADMFMYSIIGVASRSLGPKGSLTTVAPAAEAMGNVSLNVPVRSLTGNWTPRSRSNNPWFKRQGNVLSELASATTWTHAYGGVTVSVTRNESYGPSDPNASSFLGGAGLLKGTRGGNVRIGIATIRVEAMKSLTTSMLPALAEAGNLKDFGVNPRGVGLLSRLGEAAAWRLGGNPARVPFRPTVQPFLSFFLKRQLPNAVLKRLEQGLQGSRLSDGTGSRGRVDNKTQATQLDIGSYFPKR